MILDFQDAIVLTTPEPGAFLNFRWESGDGSTYFRPKITSDVSLGMLWVNGLDISEEASIYSDPSIVTELYLGETGDPSTASFFLYTRELGPFDANISIDYEYSGSITTGFASWTNYGFSSFGLSGTNITNAIGSLGVYCESNSFSVSGGNILDVSMYYTMQDGPIPKPTATFVMYEVTGDANDPSTAYKFSQVSYNENYSNSFTLDASTTSVYFRFYAETASTKFGANPITVKERGDFLEHADVSVLNRPYVVSSDSINTFESSNVQVEGDTSYMVLRTNPKFSGNIKLTIDPSNLMYLDTFKVSDVLTNKLWRKQSVSSESVLSGDIRRTFATMPLGEMYRVGLGNTRDIAIPETELWDQYDLNYSYGARLFTDELYEEDYAMLAPLWINNTLPDYFAIFRMPGQFNEESYPDIGEESDFTHLANKFLESGELMESWGIKSGTPLGTYLRNHIKELQNVIAPMFLSLSDPDLKDPDPNTWYGMTIDKGITAGRSETTYFFDQKSDNFTDLNAFSSGGFERLNILCPNLINMEYAFNDNDVSLYTMQRYYGLYLTENPLYEIAYYADSPDGSINILSLDGTDSNEFFTSAIFDASGNIIDEYKNRLFTLDDILSIERITNIHQVDGTVKEPIEGWLNKPGKNIFSIDVEKVDPMLPFISFELNTLLSQGEHLRIIDETSFVIYEIFGVDVDLLDAGAAWTYASETAEPGYPTVYRTVFSIKGTKEDQNQAIWNAWSIFENYINTPFSPYTKKKYGQSLILKEWASDHDIKFQRLTAQTTNYVFDPSSGLHDPASPFNTAAGYGDIQFYGTLEPTEDDFERVYYDASYGPINFELFGDRMAITIDLFDPAPYSLYSMDSSISEQFEEYMLYLSQDYWYRLVQYVDVSTAINHSLRYIDDPTTYFDKAIIITENPIITIGKTWNAYAPYPLTISLMGINPVKDFDYTVYDSSTLDFKSEYWYAREGDASTFEISIKAGDEQTIVCQNSFDIISGTGNVTINGTSWGYPAPGYPFRFNTFDGSAYIDAVTDTIITYAVLDSSVAFKSYKDGYSEEYIGDYYDSNTLLNYGLTIPTVTKWAGIGNDCRGNQFRLLLDTSILDVSTNFIPTDYAFPGETFYPSYKYLTPGSRNWEDYVFFDINDSIQSEADGNTEYSSFKELMFSDPYLDVFSKLMYSNNNVDGTKLRSSIVYYNNYKDTLDTVINGLSISLNIRENAKNVIDIQDWNRYRISAIAIPSRNRDNNNPMEVFINENTETILLVWYQGNDILNYTYRTASTMPGKGLLFSNTAYPVTNEFKAFDNTDKHYSHVKTPFGVNNASLSSNIFNIYGIDSTYDGSIASPFAQNNLNFGDNLFSIFNAYNGNELVGTSFEYDNRQYNSFRQYIDYSYLKSDGTYGNGIANHAYSYMRNNNLYRFETCDVETLADIFAYNKIEYYIFRENTLFRSDSFTSDPIRITINAPRSYNGVVTYNGWYTPKFNNIFEFSYNEDKEIIDIVQKDFTFGNTDLKSYSNISQLWYNKVVEQVKDYDVSAGNAINYRDSWNPFASQWDADYYTLDEYGVQIMVDGYNSTREKPSYFGSKLISLPEALALDQWNTTTTNEDILTGTIALSYNLTRSIVNIFKGNDTFIGNWSNLTQSDNIIDGYIKNTVLNYYNISKPKIKVDIWRKPYKGEITRIAYSLDDTFTKWDAANINGVLNYINNEYIYTAEVPLNPMYVYFIQYTLFEK